MLKIEDLPKEVEKSLFLNEISELKTHTFELKIITIFLISIYFFKLDFRKRRFYTSLCLKRAIQDLSTKIIPM